MDPTNFANGPDNEIYCLYCYEKIHGKKAKTKSMPLDTTSIGGDGELGTCPRLLSLTKLSLIHNIIDALEKCLLQRKWSQQVDTTIVTVFAVSSALNPWIPPVCAMVQITRSTAGCAIRDLGGVPNQSFLMKQMLPLTPLPAKKERRTVLDVLAW